FGVKRMSNLVSPHPDSRSDERATQIIPARGLPPHQSNSRPKQAGRIRYLSLEKQKDSLLLVARVLLMTLFLLFGWQKLIGFPATVAYMASTGAPLPTLSALIAVAMECVVGILLVVGFYTRPLALLLALYTAGAAFLGHRYWTMTGIEEYAS